MNNQKWLSLNFFAFFFTWGVFLPYWTGWLTNEKGLSVAAASVIVGAGMIARSLSTLFFFPAMTRFFSLGRLILVLSVLSIIVMALYIPVSSYGMLFAITVAFSLIYPNLLPAIESGATVLMQTDRIHYGKSRSFGSLGYAIALLIVGITTAIWQEASILWVMLAGLVLLTAVQLTLTPEPLATKLDPKRQDGDGAGSLWKSKGFVLMLTVAVLLQGSHAAYYNYGFIYLQDIGVESFYIGLILNIAILFEILIFAKADRWFANWNISSMLILAAAGSTLRWVLIFLFPSVWVFMLTQALHALSFGLAHFAFIGFLFKSLKPAQIPAAQGLYAALGMSLSVAVLTFVGGFLYDNVSPGASFLGMASFSVPALLIVLLTRRKLDV